MQEIGLTIMVIAIGAAFILFSRKKKNEKKKEMKNFHIHIFEILKNLIKDPQLDHKKEWKPILIGELYGMNLGTIRMTIVSEPGVSIIRVEWEYEHEVETSFQEAICKILSALKKEGLWRNIQWITGEEREIMITVM